MCVCVCARNGEWIDSERLMKGHFLCLEGERAMESNVHRVMDSLLLSLMPPESSGPSLVHRLFPQID